MSDKEGEAARARLDGLHWALLLITALGVAGTAVQLALERHWSEPWQIAPWVALLGIAVAIVVLLVSTNRTAVLLARVIAAIVLLISLVGFWQHFAANYEHGAGAETHAAVDDGEHADGDEHSDDNDHGESENEDEHAEDEEHSEEADGEEGHAEEEASVMDVLTGAAAHTPLLAPFALIQVALTLAATTIGLGGTQAASRREGS